ncbi:hypothetical protein WOLCODRAFT_22452 [Wolfiporia cocos MD-104 SS10]|uniref:Uncharacterized protein n=1 Tax=Wolfiporia cocos (strain MD-104) TaxID=742152 RepID=A0A2H3IVS2_WOLCO|nr:hypothetical protein WOLCODRAFT_22452 [Wolfiporia cocos MD-104 SS10]
MSAAPRSPGPKGGGYAEQDMFRVTPWITYDPSPDARNETHSRTHSRSHFITMNDDVDMDAPQISTLREEETPEPQPSRTSKFRVKLLVNEGKLQRSASMGSSTSQRQLPGVSDEDEDEDEDEEDQLIDDDEEEMRPTPAASVTPATPSSTRGIPTKRGRGGGRGGRRKAARTDAVVAASQVPHSELYDIAGAGNDLVPAAPGPARKKALPSKGATAQRAIKKNPSKLSKATTSNQRDDADSVISEQYPPTVASSPAPHEERSPEPECSMPPTISAMPMDDGALEGVPLPVYPLPSKPFAVQPPPKIGTGFAPVIPLDKSGKSVRRWRLVNREIRGIAGGRWFARTWAGEKESEFASAQAAVAQAAQAAADRDIALGSTIPMVSLPKLSGPSIAVPGKSSKSKAARADTTNVVISRPDSKGSESISAPPAKKRNLGNGRGIPVSEIPHFTHTAS